MLGPLLVPEARDVPLLLYAHAAIAAINAVFMLSYVILPWTPFPCFLARCGIPIDLIPKPTLLVTEKTLNFLNCRYFPAAPPLPPSHSSGTERTEAVNSAHVGNHAFGGMYDVLTNGPFLLIGIGFGTLNGVFNVWYVLRPTADRHQSRTHMSAAGDS